MKKYIGVVIALVWITNGLFCKILNLVPRHQMIVARILGEQQALVVTKIIGFLEALMAVWIVSKISSKLCSISQIILIAAMNIIECMLAPDLLLFGKLNLLFASILICIIFTNEFLISDKKRIIQPTEYANH